MTSARAAVLAHRWRAQSLDRTSPLQLLDLGVVDVPTPGARTALAIRGAEVDDSLALVWGARGAPALHRRTDLQAVADALWPQDDEDARRRIMNPRIRTGAERGLAAFQAVAEAVHDVLRTKEQLTKAELSRGVSDRIPDDLNYDCEPCGSRHVSGSVLQDAGLAGGAELVRVGRGTEYRLLPDIRIPQQRKGFEKLVAAYLNLLGPAEPADVAAYFSVAVAHVKSAWPGDDAQPVLDKTRKPRGVRLLPAGDPWLQARDREFLVAKEHHQKIWKAISPPGVVLVDGEIVGTWRGATKGKRLQVTVDAWADHPDLQEEIAIVAASRGLTTM